MVFCWICSYVLINPLTGLQLVSGWTTLSLEGKQDIQKKRSPFCTGLETSMSWEPWFLPLLCSKPRLPLGESLGFPFRWREIQPAAPLTSTLHPSPHRASREVVHGPRWKAGCSSPFIPCLGPHHSAHGDLIEAEHCWMSLPFPAHTHQGEARQLSPHCKHDLTYISRGCKFWHWERMWSFGPLCRFFRYVSDWGISPLTPQQYCVSFPQKETHTPEFCCSGSGERIRNHQGSNKAQKNTHHWALRSTLGY